MKYSIITLSYNVRRKITASLSILLLMNVLAHFYPLVLPEHVNSVQHSDVQLFLLN